MRDQIILLRILPLNKFMNKKNYNLKISYEPNINCIQANTSQHKLIQTYGQKF